MPVYANLLTLYHLSAIIICAAFVSIYQFCMVYDWLSDALSVLNLSRGADRGPILDQLDFMSTVVVIVLWPV